MRFNGSRRSDRRRSPPVEMAARWHSRLLDDDSEMTLDAFYRWYPADTANQRAYDEMESISDLAKAAASSSAAATMQREALDWLDRCRRQRRLTHLAGFAAAILLLPWFIARMEVPGIDRRYVAGHDEKLEVMLADGSRATLDGDTSIRIHYASDRRMVVLETGHALFNVSKDRARPFIVAAGPRQITAHGTMFDVLQEPDVTRVALVEGAVTVSSTTGVRVPDIAMVPNDVLVADGAVTTVHHVADASRYIRWTNRTLVFDDERLADAVRTMNLYARRPILLHGDEVGDLRINGAFHAGDTNAFAEAVQTYFNLSVENGPDGIVLSARSEGRRPRIATR